MQHPQGVAGWVVGNFLFKACSYVFHTESVHEQLGEFEDTGQEAADFTKKRRVIFRLGDQLVVLAHHGDTGGRRDAHDVCLAKHGDEAADQRDRLTVIPGVVVHLAAAGLFDGKRYGVAQPLKDACDGDACLREQGVVVAGDEECDVQNKPLLLARNQLTSTPMDFVLERSGRVK